MIAITRKVIILDPEKNNDLTLVGIGALILAIAAAVYAVKRILGRQGT